MVRYAIRLDQPDAPVARDFLEELVRTEYERCHPEDTFDDLKRRSRFSKEDAGLLRDWMAVASERVRKMRDHPDGPDRLVTAV